MRRKSLKLADRPQLKPKEIDAKTKVYPLRKYRIRDIKRNAIVLNGYFQLLESPPVRPRGRQPAGKRFQLSMSAKLPGKTL